MKEIYQMAPDFSNSTGITIEWICSEYRFRLDRGIGEWNEELDIILKMNRIVPAYVFNLSTYFSIITIWGCNKTFLHYFHTSGDLQIFTWNSFRGVRP